MKDANEIQIEIQKCFEIIKMKMPELRELNETDPLGDDWRKLSFYLHSLTAKIDAYTWVLNKL